jgi:diguanylate cyclase (GGDEF)-like protein
MTTSALESYLYSILEIAEIIEAISPEIAGPFRESLLSLRSRLAADPTPATLEQSRGALHEILQNFRQQVRLQNETLARDLQQVELLATLDPLTGVANRRDLDRELAARIEGRREFCVLLFDLNGFKEINDRFGHLYGDQVLKQLAARLSSQVRAHDYVCRWGGDEFLVILACDLAIAESRARQIAERLNGPYHILAGGRENRVNVAVTVGLVQYCAGESPEQLFRRVDEAMYRRKHSAPDRTFPAG